MSIEKGFNIFIWPKEIQSKDVNDLILSGTSKLEIKEIISNNTHKGLSAMTKLNDWKRC